MATEVMTTENGKKEDSVAEVVSGVDISNSELIKDNKDYSKDGEGGDVVTPCGRPVRERKAVDRFWISSSAAQSFAPKPLSIAKGSGTPLKDIPNVAFKLSKRKPDDTLQLLHLILFGKRAKAHNLKKDIGLFSGFVWEANEVEKQRAKMKERLDKLVKEKLFDFCDVLNIPIFKSVKKEDISVKLLEFLESPHATTEVLLADKEQKSKKRKRSVKSSKRSKKASGEKSAKKTQSREKRKRSSMSEENETDDMDDKMSSQSYSSEEEDDASLKQDSDQEQTSSDEEKDDGKDKTSPKESSKDNSEAKSGTKSVNMKKCSSEKSAKSPATSAKKSKETPNNSKSSKKTKDMLNNSKYSKKTKEASKKQKVDEETKCKKSVSTDKSPSKKARKSAKSVGGEEERNEEDKVEPSKEELHDVAVNILKEVDFNTATISDILRLLGSHFGLDLMHRKSEVKAVIQEVLESMSGGDSDGGEDDNKEEDDEDDDNKEEDDEDDKDSGEE